MINRIKKSIIKKQWMILIILSASTVGFSQRLDSVVDKFKDHRKSLLTEKIYVHCDQRFYMIGETLWFSVYYVDGVLHQPLDVSKVVYVEILNDNNTPVLSAKIELKNGRGNGSFYIPSTINSGSFTLRAYTHWMRNFDASYYFHQAITIVNPFTAPETPSNTPKTVPSIAFFPEGGHLVSGLKSKVGFKISDTSGYGLYGEGAILNSNNDTIVDFTTGKFGMGNFEFTPTTSEKYHVMLKGTNQIYSIPQAEKEGYVMQLTDSSDRFIRIKVSSKFDDALPAFVSLFVHTRQMISVADVKPLRNGSTIFSIDKDKLPGGITHFTLFNEEGSPVCERLVFKYPKNNLAINITSSDNEIRSRRKVALTINALKNFDGSPTPADLSISVYKKDSFATIPSRDIFQYLWLSSDLTGDVESENYYFTTDSLVNETVDNLMLTHGWRRFKWDDILSGENEINYFPEYRSHIISASVIHSDSVAPAMLTYLSVPGSATALYSSRSSQGGDLQYEVNNFYGTRKILLQSSAESPSSALEILNPFSVQYAQQNRQPFTLHPLHSSSLLQRSVAMQTEDIFHDERHNMELAKTDTIAFYGKADETYYLDDYTRFPVMEEVMREYVRGVFVRKRKDGFHFIVVNDVKDGVLEKPMILLDGVPLFDADRIMEVAPLKIKKVEVIKRRFFLGPVTFNGIVSFTSYKGDVAEIQFDPGTITMDYEGLQQQREFFEPKYATQKQLSSRLPDRRYLLYWNPQIRADNEGKLQVEFYTSDIAGEFEIIVQGMTADGYSGTGRSVIKVK